VKKTLVVRLDHLGDVVLTTPLIRALALGGHTVDVLVKQAFEPILKHSPYIRECFAQEAIAPGFPKGWWKLGAWMREGGYNNIVVPYAREKRLCFASMISGADARIAMWSGIWGRVTGHKCLRSEMISNPRPFSEILLSCSRALGVPDQGLQPDIFLTNEERAATRRLWPVEFRHRKIVGIHPGCAGNTCNLPSNVYAGLAALILKETDYAIVLTGTTNEQNLLAQWPTEILRPERVWNSMGRVSVRQLACLISDMDVLIVTGTGPLHIASAVGTATVSPFCPFIPLSPAVWGNVGGASRTIEPATCPLRSGGGGCCDFLGQIPSEKLFHETVELISSSSISTTTS
jgi:ADP-heptose:LPS heptosyltransferase